MPKLRLFRGDTDPLESDVIPFPLRRTPNPVELHLTDLDVPVDSISHAEEALEEAESQLERLQTLFNANDLFDDDGPRAA